MIAGIRGRHDVSDEEGSSSNAAIGGAHRKPGNADTGLDPLSPAAACAFRGGTVGLQPMADAGLCAYFAASRQVCDQSAYFHD
jgi:hypothetical protein